VPLGFVAKKSMSETAIKVEHLSKRYRIGTQDEVHDTFAGALSAFVRSPIKNLRRLRGLSRLEAGEADDIIWALKDVSFEVQRGEVLGIIGRNGAGKSTLLKILSRITEPSSGRAVINGRVSSLLEVGTGFHPELTGRENVYLNGTILGMRKAEIDRKFDEIVDFSGVEKFIDTPVKFYSSGMRVRLAFSVAAHLEPEILLIDEVLAVGDASFQKKCLGKMGDVALGGRTVLFVSHNMAAMRSLCERVILLLDGKIDFIGSAESAINTYLHTAKKGLLEKSWKYNQAPGNEKVKIKRMKLVRTDQSDLEPLNLNTPFNFEFEFWNLQSRILNLSLHIKLISGETVFAVATPRERLDIGLARYVCHIPGQLLNDSIYTTKIMIVENARSLYTIDDGLVFEIVDILGRDGGWMGKWPGYVRPKLSWTRDFIKQDEITNSIKL